ncbi:MAG: Flp pilus assembly complex ATPase component TadA [Kiritimatiellae bacterium]|nr:Flp pilus assembly complex ATPase component TadA [Kiritimatiellia bacterium]
MQLEIRQPDKDPRSFDVEQGIYTIGSDDDCRLCLPHPDVDSRHAVLTITDDAIWIDDLNARATTTVNGSPVRNRTAVKPQQVIGVGPYSLIMHASQPVPAEPEPAPTAPAPVAAVEPKPEPTPAVTAPEEKKEDDSLIEQKRSITAQIHRELLERMDIRRMTAAHVDPEELGKRAHETIVDIVNDVRNRLPPTINSEELIREVYNEALKLGPLEDLLEDPDITEIMVNGHKKVYIEKAGKLIRTHRTFMNDDSVLAIIERIVSPIGRRIDESQPYVDARLPDGSRVNAIIHPLSLIGPCLTIRKFSKVPLTDQNMLNYGTFTPSMAEFFRICVMLRKNIIVSGGTGSGKTTLLNVLSNYLPDHDRIVTIEDAAELRLGQQHVVRLEARPPNIEGKGAITIRDLVRNALRMRPDRIIVGECRGAEALDMLQAMNTGHDGSLTTIHANSPRDVISRLETMVLMSGMELPVRAIREQVASAIDVIVHESRFSDGTRKVTRVTEIVGLEGDLITMQDIFEHTQTGVGENGQVIGHFAPTGAVPTFIEDIAAQGFSIDRGMFDPMRKDV